MSTTIQVPKEFGYVGAALISTVWLILGQGFIVGRYRKRAKIEYPQMYAELAQVEKSRDALLFNCAQRAHQNTLESIPVIWASTAIVGTQMPVLAASVCGIWTISRISYTLGYLTGNPRKRVNPIYGVGLLGSLGLTATATAYGARWVWEGISAKLGF
ncbi:hypothetical protein D9756_006025 [Leucocoprinus leucothites]|uniref:Membrane-associated proteins in eicosanoid and glutathione metabolism n=1 Tax=Leucocoprinus leucothites TaxID=201217 RepID=A0A8H5FWV0_9AGAR|nr:hypothetical protein D9756_006025 [Leucoagaricus leucothites]